jgi:hypothetical protein
VCRVAENVRADLSAGFTDSANLIADSRRSEIVLGTAGARRIGRCGRAAGVPSAKMVSENGKKNGGIHQAPDIGGP